MNSHTIQVTRIRNSGKETFDQSHEDGYGKNVDLDGGERGAFFYPEVGDEL